MIHLTAFRKKIKDRDVLRLSDSTCIPDHAVLQRLNPSGTRELKGMPDRLSLCSVKLLTILLETERTEKKKENKAVTKRDVLCRLSQLSTEENLLSGM